LKNLPYSSVFVICYEIKFDIKNFVSEDIQVVFSHEGWEALGDFSAPDVHRQVGTIINFSLLSTN